MERQPSNSSIQVYVRLRPLIHIERGSQQVVEVLPDNKTVRVAHQDFNHLQIKFDRAFNPNITQQSIYEHFQNIIPQVIEGYNVTIFAYGQTGSGKTHTMFGRTQNQQQLSPDEFSSSEAGVIPRAISQLFNRLKSLNANVFCSFLQIYNQKIYDLLQDTQKPKPLSIHQSKVQGIFVEGLTQFGVENSSDCMELLMQGLKNRVIRQTSMNAKSSRSHSIFQLLVEIQDSNGSYLKGRLNLCDLAGSEKINKKEAMGNQQLKELKNINLSLTTLGKVIYALSSGDKKVSGAFRESKLTRLLQDSLTGNTYTFIMANLSPSLKNLEETINTLKFVERANHITLKVKPTEINSHNPDTVLKLQKQVEYLKQLLNLKKQGINPQQMPQQLKRLRKEHQHIQHQKVSQQELQHLMKENREMKKQIHNLQVKLEQTEGTQTSRSSQYIKGRQKQKQLQQQKLQYYMPSSRDPSSRNSSKTDERLSNSLVQAGRNIAFNLNTIDHPNRQQEKKNLALRLQQFEDKQKHQEYKLIEDYQQYDKKTKNRYSPPKLPSSPSARPKLSGKRDEAIVVKNRKKVDYTDRIKQLQARLFGK